MDARLASKLQWVADWAVMIAKNRADNEDWRDWCDPYACRRYIALLRSTRAYVGCNGHVIVRVSGPDVDVWGYAAHEVLDAAVCGDYVPMPGDWHIDEIKPGVMRLTPCPGDCSFCS